MSGRVGTLLLVVALMAPAAAQRGRTGSRAGGHGADPVDRDVAPVRRRRRTNSCRRTSPSVGYVEEEYFVSGKANVYEWPQAGPAVVRTADAPYTTRMLVRRPINPADSSGNVVVEMLNPSNHFDINIGWAIMRKHFVRTGDTWVGITSRPNNVTALRNFDPQRYAALNWANPLPVGHPDSARSPASRPAPSAASCGTSTARSRRG